jgi:hypothetical protein
MRPQALLTLVLAAIAIPVGYHAFVVITAKPPPPKAPEPAIAETPKKDLKIYRVKPPSEHPRRNVPGREYVPPLPAGLACS